MSSLQDQLLKSGLVDSKKAKQVKKSKKKQNKAAHKSKQPIVDEGKEVARKALKEKAEQSRKVNEEKNRLGEEKALLAQIKQIVLLNKIDGIKGDIGFNFADGTKVKKLYVSDSISTDLSKGRLAIVKIDEINAPQYYVIAKKVAEKISERNESVILLMNKNESNDIDEDDPYADFQIPDDLMW